VLTQDLCYFCEVDATTVDRALQGAAFPPQVLVLNPRTLAQIFDTIQRVGQACGVPQAAAELVAGLQGRVAAVTRRLDTVRRRPRVWSLEGVNPLVIGGHWIPDLLRLAGGAQDRYPPGCPAARVPWQEVVECQPDKLFIDLCSSDLARSLREVAWLAAQEGWQDLPAVRSGEVYLMDHVYFSSPGPRVVQGLEILAQLTHPDRFSGLLPPQAVMKLDAALAARCPVQDIARCFRPYGG
jgi:iron complex transport system substrate-binding protein